MIRFSIVPAAAALLLAGSPPCPAADALANLFACRSIPQSAARLACFDRESARLAALRGHDASEAAGTRVVSLEPQRTFGLPQGVIDARAMAAGVQPKPLSRVSTRIARISPGVEGRLIFTLENGQVWTDLEENDNLLANPGQAVKISRQLFGSYWMELQSGRGCKVERLR